MAYRDKEKMMKADEALKTTEVMPQPEAALSRGFYKIVRGSTALALGCMAAAVQAVGRSAAGFTFQVSVWTFVAFAVGLAAGLLYWRLAARSLLAVRLGTTLLVLAGVGGFLYPLRFVPADKLADIAIGLGMAVCAVSMGAFLLWKLKRFFDKDNAAVEIKKG
jgi:protein-S-isoprenylcysteine O-methyltransferase Ste14